MRRLASALVLLALGAPAALHASAGPAEGLWRTEAEEDGGYLVIRIRSCDDDPSLTCGVIERAYGPEGPQPDYPHLGERLIRDMERGNGAWTGGDIRAPDEDRTYDAEMTLKDGVLTVEGCVLLFCREQDWKRVE
jgi:uncharacterized protein (DUF2147 family)